MRWHKEGKRDSEDSDIMSHPVDGEAWQDLDRFDPKFARDPRSVCLGLLMGKDTRVSRYLTGQDS
jgi:hypothetical protein